MTDKPGLEALRDTGSLKLPAIAHSPLRFCHPAAAGDPRKDAGCVCPGGDRTTSPAGGRSPAGGAPPHPPRPAGAARRAAGPCDGSPLRQGGRPRHGSYRRFSWNPARCTPPPQKRQSPRWLFSPPSSRESCLELQQPVLPTLLGLQTPGPDTHARAGHVSHVCSP